MYISYLEYPFGYIQITGNSKAIVSVEFLEGMPKISESENEITIKAKSQLKECLDGKRKTFDIPLELIGTQFQVRVWKELIKIPFGETISYKELAQRSDSPKGYRAVGMANNKNKIAVIIPCHRVIGSNGTLTGYAGGLDTKQFFLNLEKESQE